MEFTGLARLLTRARSPGVTYLHGRIIAHQNAALSGPETEIGIFGIEKELLVHAA
jgi:hypothetical protein